MSYMVARMQKMKAGNLGGAYKHNERVFETHSNKDIDPSRSPLNYELTDRDHSVSYEKKIKDYVNENKISNRAIRKDAVLCDEWIITSDKSFFEKLSEEKQGNFLRPKIILRKIMARTISLMQCPLRRKHTPHMHMGVVPFKMGNCLLRQCLTKKNSKKFKKICQNT